MTVVPTLPVKTGKVDSVTLRLSPGPPISSADGCQIAIGPNLEQRPADRDKLVLPGNVTCLVGDGFCPPRRAGASVP